MSSIAYLPESSRGCALPASTSWNGWRRAIARTLARGGRASLEETQDVYQSLIAALFEPEHRRLKTFRGDAGLRAWLVAVATRFSLDQLRKLRVRRTSPLQDIPAEERVSPDETLPEIEQLHEALNQLSEQDALVLRLYHFDGISYPLIAKLLGIPLNTLCPRISRAREKLRRILAQSGHYPDEPDVSI